MRLLFFLLISAGINAAEHSEARDPVSVVQQCSECGLEKLNLKQCSQCKSAFYCCEACQKNAWKNHQRICCNMHLLVMDDEIVCKYHDNQGTRDLTQAEFKTLTKKVYVNESLYSKAQKSKAPRLDKQYALQREIAIDAVALCFEGEDRGFGVVALRDIKEGEILCRFGGEAVPAAVWEKEKHSNQADACAIGMEDFVLDPSSYTSLAAFINDGPPNCELLNIALAKGQQPHALLSVEKFAIAIAAIKKGDFIYHDYCFSNAIKQSMYSFNDDALKNFANNYVQALDFTKLVQLGPANSSFVESRIEPDYLSLTKLQYILATPNINAMLHTRFGLDPAKTLESLEQLKHNKKNGCIWKYICEAKILMRALAKVEVQDRVDFSKLVQEISQKSLIILSTFLEKQSLPISMDNIYILGRALDKLILMTHGTNFGTYWNSSEREMFKIKYHSSDHQKELNDECMIATLPIEYLNFYRDCRKALQHSLYKY